MSETSIPLPLSAGQGAVLRALNRLGAHDALMAMHVGRVAGAARMPAETTRHLLNRLYANGLLDRTRPPHGDGGWSYWLTAAGLAEARKVTPP